jgi:hypothetical protein
MANIFNPSGCAPRRNEGTYITKDESQLRTYLHADENDEVQGRLGYDCAKQRRILEYVLVLAAEPNNDGERGNFYPRVHSG